MKRSKLFLGITTGVLAIVAFSAAKVSKYTTKVLGYYSAGNSRGAHCTLGDNSSKLYYTGGVSQAAIGTIGLYEVTSGKCAIPLFTRQAQD